MTFKDACDLVKTALTARGRIIEEMMQGSESDAFKRLGSAICHNAFPSGPSLRAMADGLDAKCRREGLHLLQAWDFKIHRFSNEPAAALLVEYCSRLQRGADARMSVAILLDVYFYTLLSLLAARSWDEGEANANLDRVTSLVEVTRREGSGLSYVDDAETLLFLSASYFHPDERSYETLLDRVRKLDERHRLRVARPSGAMLSAHLRWGLRFMYERDITRMQKDNVADYPWLHFAADTLASNAEAEAEALLVTLAGDPWSAIPRMTVAGDELRHVVAPLQPSHREFSPLGVTFNFPSNAAVALVAISIEDGRFYPPLNALFSRSSGESGAELAERLMKHSAADPSRLGARGIPLVIHDPTEAARAYNDVMRALAPTAARRPHA
jgi:hypothetical protein